MSGDTRRVHGEEARDSIPSMVASDFDADPYRDVNAPVYDINDSRTFPARMAQIQRANAFLISCIARVRSLHLSDALLFDLRLAVTETLANIIEHSYGNDPDQTVRMTVRLDSDRIELIFADVGRPPEPRRLRWRNLAEFRERGLGLFLLSKCMDGVIFHFRRDGINRVHLFRAIGGEGAAARGGEHLPFHTAIFDTAKRRVVYLIGHFDRTRIDPLAAVPVGVSRKLVFDLSGLDFIDAFGIECLTRYARLVTKEGVKMSAVEPPPAVACVIQDSGLMETIASNGWSREISSEPRITGRRDLSGGYLPLVRALAGPWHDHRVEPSALDAGNAPGTGDASGTGDAPGAGDALSTGDAPGAGDSAMMALMAPLAPREVAGTPEGAVRGLSVNARLSWSNPSYGLFARIVSRYDEIETTAQGYASGGVVFAGCSSRPGSLALVAAHQLHAMLAAYPAFTLVRGGRTTLSEFLRHVSSQIRDALPAIVSEEEGFELLMVAVEFSPRGVRAVTGNGPMIARVAGVPLMAISLGQSENSVIEMVDLPQATGNEPAYRIFIGHGLDEETSRGDTGVLDVRVVNT